MGCAVERNSRITIEEAFELDQRLKIYNRLQEKLTLVVQEKYFKKCPIDGLEAYYFKPCLPPIHRSELF